MEEVQRRQECGFQTGCWLLKSKQRIRLGSLNKELKSLEARNQKKQALDTSPSRSIRTTSSKDYKRYLKDHLDSVVSLLGASRADVLTFRAGNLGAISSIGELGEECEDTENLLRQLYMYDFEVMEVINLVDDDAIDKVDDAYELEEGEIPAEAPLKSVYGIIEEAIRSTRGEARITGVLGGSALVSRVQGGGQATADLLDLEAETHDRYDFLRKIEVLREDGNKYNFTKAKFKMVKKRISDLQLGIESYQYQLNLTKPRLKSPGIKDKEPYSMVDKPQFCKFYLKNNNEKRFMDHSEAHKFCSYTLEEVKGKIHFILLNHKYKYANPPLRKDQVTRSWIYNFNHVNIFGCGVHVVMVRMLLDPPYLFMKELSKEDCYGLMDQFENPDEIRVYKENNHDSDVESDEIRDGGSTVDTQEMEKVME
ncbi:hypothetical protein Tco_0040379 [Tanacetum coccineum]